MPDFNRTHAAIFDELERQGAMHVDIARLTQAVIGAKDIIAAQPPRESYRRCASGTCED